VPDSIGTGPKPFVFVLMPFKSDFNDIYSFGIKGAADDVGAYAERLNDQLFAEGMIERIFNQINKADVIVADMTGQNPNVFYEVGYAHALNKLTLLLTQDTTDIPFDLKHRQHIVYGDIGHLRSELQKHLDWAITESKNRQVGITPRHFRVTVNGTSIPERRETVEPPSVTVTIQRPLRLWPETMSLQILVINDALRTSKPVSPIYLFTPPSPRVLPCRIEFDEESGAEMEVSSLPSVVLPDEFAIGELSVQYQLVESVPSLPPRTAERFHLNLRLSARREPVSQRMAVRLSCDDRALDFEFLLNLIQGNDSQDPRRALLK
jgi:nucleoside 2-deoxyribosyltransferase